MKQLPGLPAGTILAVVPVDKTLQNATGKKAWVIPTNEELEIANECYTLLQNGA